MLAETNGAVSRDARAESRPLKGGATQFIDNRAQHFVVCSFNHFIL
jgi:hypothetical protein